ncbi:MAG: hypothetical protein GY839_21270 [candidate division Zixibacteria bacterium]|nr:hypothetical protein [candidate division Zixibacteria bacterium]
MIKLSSIILALFLLAICLSCSLGTDPAISFIFPLEIGNRWEYSRTFSYTNIRPDTFEISPDTWRAEAILEINSLDHIFLPENSPPEFIEAYHLREEYIDDDTSVYEGDAYYRNAIDGLYSYNSGSIPIWLSDNTIIPENFTIGIFSINDVMLFKNNSTLDTIIYNAIPQKILYYPIDMGSQWRLRDREDNSGFRIDKKVVGSEVITVPAGEFVCVIIQWLYDFDRDECWDDDIEFYDYLCEVGLIKRTILFKDNTWPSEYGENLGLVDSITEIVLTDYHLE